LCLAPGFAIKIYSAFFFFLTFFFFTLESKMFKALSSVGRALSRAPAPAAGLARALRPATLPLSSCVLLKRRLFL
jgi:hypothetical protein